MKLRGSVLALTREKYGRGEAGTQAIQSLRLAIDIHEGGTGTLILDCPIEGRDADGTMERSRLARAQAQGGEVFLELRVIDDHERARMRLRAKVREVAKAGAGSLTLLASEILALLGEADPLQEELLGQEQRLVGQHPTDADLEQRVTDKVMREAAH